MNIETVEDLNALPEYSVVVVEVEDASSGEVFPEAFQKDAYGWCGTMQGDYPESQPPNRVMRPFMAFHEDAVRVRLVYTPERDK